MGLLKKYYEAKTVISELSLTKEEESIINDIIDSKINEIEISVCDDYIEYDSKTEGRLKGYVTTVVNKAVSRFIKYPEVNIENLSFRSAYDYDDFFFKYFNSFRDVSEEVYLRNKHRVTDFNDAYIYKHKYSFSVYKDKYLHRKNSVDRLFNIVDFYIKSRRYEWESEMDKIEEEREKIFNEFKDKINADMPNYIRNGLATLNTNSLSPLGKEIREALKIDYEKLIMEQVRNIKNESKNNPHKRRRVHPA